MRRTLVLLLMAAVLAWAGPRVAAQGRGGSKGPKPGAAAGAPKAKPAPAPRTAPARGSAATRTAANARPRPAASTAPATARTSALPRNPHLVARLQGLLPAGTDMTAAASGFRNQGQFVAAVHVSHNLGIPFADLRSRMVNDGLSLGQAIQALRPRADADREARLAVNQANADLSPPRRNTNRRVPR